MKTDKKTYVYIGITLVCVYLFTQYWSAAAEVLLLAVGAAMPLIVGCIIAYVVNILMTFYERLYFPHAKKTIALRSRRPVCLVLAFLSFVGIVFVIIKLIVPELVNCITLLVRQIPAVFDQLSDIFKKYDVLQRFFQEAEHTVMAENTNLQEIATKVVNWIVSGLGGIMGTIGTILSSTFSMVVTFFVGLVFSVYLLVGKEQLAKRTRKVMQSYLSEKWVRRICYCLHVLHKSFRSFIVGQFTEAVILGVLCIVGMSIFKFPYATMIGTFIGFTALIPIVGAYLGACVGALMIVTVSPVQAVLFIIFIIVLQQLEGNLIYPRVVGSSIGLPGIWVLTAVTIGGGLFGISGMLLGVPLAAALYQMLRHDVEKRTTILQKTAETHEDEQKDGPSDQPS